MSIKKSTLNRNERKIQLVNKMKEKRLQLVKNLRSSKNLKEIVKARAELGKLPVDSATTRIRNRCSITGRARAYNRKFGLARAEILRLVYKGKLYGWKGSSW